VGGLNTLGHAPSRTLSGHTELCPARPLCPWKDNILETWKNLNFADCNATKHLYIVYNIYIYNHDMVFKQSLHKYDHV
jgi:hypothetical protein